MEGLPRATVVALGGRADEIPLLAEEDDDVDGRTLRRRRNREAVIGALGELITEGEVDPTVAKIADRAGVSHRSVFRYFTDLDDLARAAIEDQVRKVLPDAVIPDVGQGSLEHRIEAIVATRIKVTARFHNLGRVARVKAPRIPAIDENLHVVAGLMRDQVARHFAPEVKVAGDEDGELLVESAAVAIGFESYDYLRRLLGLDDERIAEIWTFSLHRLFG